MKKIINLTCAAFVYSSMLYSHCQMPCGIYHDDMVFDQIDQYVETMVKGISKLKDNKNENAQDRNECIRWVMTKDRMSDETANLITTYFLQQKIKPGEEDTTKRLISAHKLLFDLTAIKQSADFKPVADFAEEWEKFKLFFHIKGYECMMEQRNIKVWDEKRKEYEAKEKDKAGAPETNPQANKGATAAAPANKASTTATFAKK